jgi:hypothetical protein
VPLTEGDFAVKWKVKDKDKEHRGNGGEGGSDKGGSFRLGSKKKGINATDRQQE